MTRYPPCFFITSDAGCIGRFWWINTQQRPPGWIVCQWPFPIWGTSHWFSSTPEPHG